MTATIPLLPMQEALDFWKAKTPLQAEAFHRLADEYRVRAFTVSGLAKMDQIVAVQKSLGKALARGEDFEVWSKGIGGVFQKAGWTGNHFYRLDLIFRTNIQTAYNAGRWTQAQEARGTHPYAMYDAIDDDRVRPSHHAQDGKVYHLDHPFWKAWWPPNGYKCRCSVRMLSRDQVEALGLKVQHRVQLTYRDAKGRRRLLRTDKGFGTNPGLTPFEVQLDRYPAHLKEQFLEGASRQPLALMRKYLTQKDLEDLNTLVWARQQPVEGYKEWVAQTQSRGEACGLVYPVGALPGRVLFKLEQQPRLALVVMSDQALLHLVRDAKQVRGVALSMTEIQAITSRLSARDSEWYLDRRDGGVLLVWQRLGDLWVKVEIQVNRQVGTGVEGGIANEIVRAGVVQDKNLGNQLKRI